MPNEKKILYRNCIGVVAPGGAKCSISSGVTRKINTQAVARACGSCRCDVLGPLSYQ